LLQDPKELDAVKIERDAALARAKKAEQMLADKEKEHKVLPIQKHESKLMCINVIGCTLNHSLKGYISM